MVNHLGKKPVSGGNPARESKVNMRVAFSERFFVHDVIRVESFRALVELRVRNTVVVIRVYR